MNRTWEDISEHIDAIPEAMCGAPQPEFLYQLARRTRGEGAIVEIGTCAGKSTIAIAFAQQEKGGRPLVTIDIAEHPSLRANLAGAGVEAWVDARIMRSTDAAKGWSEPVEMLWIDGDHATLAIMADIDAWSPHVMVGGIMAFHDYPGVMKSMQTWNALYRKVFANPYEWRVIADREAGSIIAFERLQPPPERDLKERAKQQVRWARTNWRFVKKEAKAMAKRFGSGS